MFRVARVTRDDRVRCPLEASNAFRVPSENVIVREHLCLFADRITGGNALEAAGDAIGYLFFLHFLQSCNSAILQSEITTRTPPELALEHRRSRRAHHCGVRVSRARICPAARRPWPAPPCGRPPADTSSRIAFRILAASPGTRVRETA